MNTVLVPTSTCLVDSSRVSAHWALWVLPMRDTERPWSTYPCELLARCLSGSAAANPTLGGVSPCFNCYMLSKGVVWNYSRRKVRRS